MPGGSTLQGTLSEACCALYHLIISVLLRTVRNGIQCGSRSPSSPLLAVPNVTVHPSTVDVPITALLYNGSLLCGFNVARLVPGWMTVFGRVNPIGAEPGTQVYSA